MNLGLADGIRARSFGNERKWIPVPDGMYGSLMQSLFLSVGRLVFLIGVTDPVCRVVRRIAWAGHFCYLTQYQGQYKPMPQPFIPEYHCFLGTS